MYTVFIVTGFFWITSVYLALSVEWRQQAYKQLIALNLAQDHIERAWIKDADIIEKTVVAKDLFTIELHAKKYPMPQNIPRLSGKEASIRYLDVLVTWPDQKGAFHTVRLQSHR